MKPSHSFGTWFAVAGLILLTVGAGVLLVPRLRHREVPAVPVPTIVSSPEPTRGPAQSHSPLVEATRPPQVWAIVIGVEGYRDHALPKGKSGAGRDASVLGRWLVDVAGWGRDHVLLMDELGDAEPSPSGMVDDLIPSHSNLSWAFGTWLSQRVRPGDSIVVAFFGRSAILDENRTVLLPVDAWTAHLDTTGWALEDALDDLAAPGLNPVICWLDAAPLPVPGNEDPHREVDRWLSRLARWPGVTAWLVPRASGDAEPPAPGTPGPFASALMSGLGTRDRPRTVLACLDRLNRDPALNARGFRTLGGIAPNLTLWSGQASRGGDPPRELLLQRAHAGSITALAFTADGSRMVTASHDSTVKLWRVADRTVLRSLPHHLVGVTGLALSPDGSLLLSADGAGWLRAWDLARSRELATSAPHERGVEVLTFLPDGRHFASLDRSGRAWLWLAEDPARAGEPLAESCTGLASASDLGPAALVLATADGKLTLFDRDGRRGQVLDGPGGLVTSPALASDGRRVAAGDRDGRVLVVNPETGAEVYRHDFGTAIEWLGLSPTGGLAVAAGSDLHVIPFDQENPGPIASGPLPGPIHQATFSPDGRSLAACTTAGHLLAWRLDPEKPPQSLPLGEAAAGLATAVAFAPDGRGLAVGDQDGGWRTWDLPDGTPAARVLPHRGQVVDLSVSADGRYLLQVTRDRRAQVWDLQDGRSLNSIPGEWTSGALAPDGQTLALTDADSGNVVLVDRARGQVEPRTFARPAARSGSGPVAWPFARVAFSPDGRLIAAATPGGPLACVWEAETGRLVQEVRGEFDPVSGLGFSADSTRLVTASEDGTARLWDLTAEGPEPREVAAFEPGKGPLSAAAIDPTDPGRVATGDLDGRVTLWEVGQDQPVAPVGNLDGAVAALTFTSEGRWLAATGADKSVRIWERTEAGETWRPLRLSPSPQHAERVNALLAWPGGRLIASGSNDTTIRLWDLADLSLLGTLSAEQGTSEWLAYTPDGLYDGSPGAEAHVTWLGRDDLIPLEQYPERFHIFRLTDRLRRGERPPVPEAPRIEPPKLSIDRPPRALAWGRDEDLVLTLGESGLADIRLYHDGVPIRSEADLEFGPEGRRAVPRVRLHRGDNHFYALASRPGAIDGRSNEVVIHYDGSDDPGRVHIIALGVAQYSDPDFALGFATADAEQVADLFHRSGADESGTPGLRQVLTDAEVTDVAVDAAFHKVRDAVADRPEDTVVVFLAGHTAVLYQRFYLLLPGFPFPDQPGDTTPPRLVGSQVPHALPYVALERNLFRLGALKRLVVIDACQAEAIFDDLGVQLIEQLADDSARRTRTSYLLAARAGEPAGEEVALRHGMLTYVLLRGLGQSGLEPVPGLALFDALPNADRDSNGWVTTDELRSFVSATLPPLAANFPSSTFRLGLPPHPGSASSPKDAAPPLRLQGANSSFRLLPLPEASQREKEGPDDSTMFPGIPGQTQ